MHADWQLTGSEPSGIEYVQHKSGHDFAAVSIPLYCTVLQINVLQKLTYHSTIYTAVCTNVVVLKHAAVQRCQLVAPLNRHSGTGGVQKCMQTGN